MPKENKSTDVEMLRRVETIFELQVKGLSRAEILQYVSTETTWNVDPRTVDDYISRAKKLFVKNSRHDKKSQVGKAIARLEHLFMRNMKINDFKAALSVQKELNTLLGLYEPERHEFTGKDGSPLIPSPNVYLPGIDPLPDDDLETS